MNKILLIQFFISNFLFSQVGINIDDPKATLHIEPYSITNPSQKDGILIPKSNDFPTNPTKKGHMIFIENNPSLADGFYYWDGIDWESFIIDKYDRSFDSSIYVFTGLGYSGTGDVSKRDVLFDIMTAADLTNFLVKDNKITIGKTGKYHISFSSSLKKPASSPTYRATYTYRVMKNNVEYMQTSSSIPNSSAAAASVSTSSLIELKKGDIISVTVQKGNENNASNEYTGYGTNCITLTYLNS